MSCLVCRLRQTLTGTSQLKACILLTAAAILVPGPKTSPKENAQPEYSSQEFLNPVKVLASDKMKGRGDGSRQLNEAARYIEGRFKKFGLEPAGDSRTYFQHFPITVGAKLGSKNHLTYEGAGAHVALKPGRDFIPFSFSEDVQLRSPMVFAGYGITAPEFNYDDYNGIDAKGKIVLVLRHEPQENDAKSVFAGKQLTTHAEIVNKAINAKNHGAVGMILVNDLGNHPGEPDDLFRFGALVGPEEMKIAALQVKAAVADEWLKPSGQTLEGLRAAIDKDLSIHSFALDPSAQLALHVDVKRIRKRVENVVGILPGQDAKYAQQCIVLGAHYDHLGFGDQHSLAPSQIGKIHHGADDNASGTSGLLELADGLARERAQLKHAVVFVAFTAEESGLLGSNFYAAHPACPMDQTLAMLNMDMIGRVKNNKLYVGGTGTSPDFKKLVETANRQVGFELSYSASGYGASDHTSFAVKSVPVLFFFSGLHSDYHKPSDTWEKINADGGAKVVDLVANVVGELDQLEEKPQYVRVAEPSHTAIGGGGGGYGPYFGSIPDFGEIEHGVKFADVRDGSPAAKAGFKSGDVLIQFGDKKIDNLYDFTYALRAHKPGDKVQVTVLRGSEKLTREVTLEVRK
ncbi:MAG: M20/M25/M40 family metallo-hydrolase [Acidobacteriia bacterium]|nr:M20/M25/M40 family metallo-hydrolase [Terriglobia bacterium]